MKIIVTGGMGFIGSNLINRLREKNEIVVLDNLSTSVNNSSADLNFLEVDLSNWKDLSELQVGSSDVLIHLAGPSSGPASAKFPQETIDQSNSVTFNMLNFCASKSIKKIIFASSMAVYGNPLNSPVLETNYCEPISYYGIAKLSSEHIIQAFSKANNIDYTILRFFNIYGPGQDLNRMDQGLVSIYLSMLLNEKPFIIKGSLDRVRDLIHIDDVASSVESVLNSENSNNQILNICNGKGVSIKKLAETLISHFDDYSFSDIIEEAGSTGDTNRIYGDNSKLKKLTNFKPMYDLDSGIKDFVKWAKKSKI